MAIVEQLQDASERKHHSPRKTNGAANLHAPDFHSPDFLARIAGASADEKEAAMEAAVAASIAEIESGRYVEGTAAEVMAAIRAGRSFEDMAGG